jgi:hypothetical protein
VRREEPPVPDVRGMLARGLRYEALNQGITRCYTQMAPLFDRIASPPGSDSATRSAPNWFAIASYASRGAGRGEIAAGQALRVLDAPSMSPAAALREAWPDLPQDQAGALGAHIQRDFLGDEADLATWLVALGLGFARSAEGRFMLDHLALLDPRILAISVKRLGALTAQAPGATLGERLAAVAQTMRNGLEDGNRRIVADIGVAGQRYLEWRRGRPSVTPEEVLRSFSLSAPPDPAQASELFNDARRACEGNDPLPGDLETLYPPSRYDANQMMVAGFALYEQAGATADPRVRNRLIAFANNYLAYKEQHDAAQPAFTPGRILPGETPREPVWQLLTPLVDIEARYGTWSFHGYADAHLPPRDHNPLTPRVTEYNWGTFRDRWFAILDAFDDTYAHPAAMWPQPNPDPARGIDDPILSPSTKQHHD